MSEPLTKDQRPPHGNCTCPACAPNMQPAGAPDAPLSSKPLLERLRTFPMFVRNGALWVESTAIEPTCLEAADEIERLTRELHYTTQAGVIECAVRNPAVAEYMRHWESRTEKAEAEYERLRAIATNVESLQCEIERLRAALDHAEACMSIIEPRNSKAEYLACLREVREALGRVPRGADEPESAHRTSGG